VGGPDRTQDVVSRKKFKKKIKIIIDYPIQYDTKET
jgi:hypothetical protein